MGSPQVHDVLQEQAGQDALEQAVAAIEKDAMATAGMITSYFRWVRNSAYKAGLRDGFVQGVAAGARGDQVAATTDERS